MIGFVDAATREDRLNPMVAPCGWCRGPVHRADSHVRVRDFCSLSCVEKDYERDLEERRMLGRALNLGVRTLLALVGLGILLRLLHGLGLVGPQIPHP